MTRTSALLASAVFATFAILSPAQAATTVEPTPALGTGPDWCAAPLDASLAEAVTTGAAAAATTESGGCQTVARYSLR